MSFTRSYTSFPTNGCGGLSFSWLPLKAFFNRRYGWKGFKNLLCLIYTVFFLCLSWMKLVFLSQIGHAWCPLTLYPLKFPYARKSITVQNTIDRNLKGYCRFPSHTSTPSSHNIFKSSINRVRYTSISFPSCLGPAIIIHRIMYFRKMHNQEGRL